jgi:hypothetical protein
MVDDWRRLVDKVIVRADLEVAAGGRSQAEPAAGRVCIQAGDGAGCCVKSPLLIHPLSGRVSAIPHVNDVGVVRAIHIEASA